LADPHSTRFNFQNHYGFGLIGARAVVTLAQAFTPPAGLRSTNWVKPVAGEQVTTPFGSPLDVEWAGLPTI
jgi:hypothetical protein